MKTLLKSMNMPIVIVLVILTLVSEQYIKAQSDDSLSLAKKGLAIKGGIHNYYNNGFGGRATGLYFFSNKVALDLGVSYVYKDSQPYDLIPVFLGVEYAPFDWKLDMYFAVRVGYDLSIRQGGWSGYSRTGADALFNLFALGFTYPVGDKLDVYAELEDKYYFIDKNNYAGIFEIGVIYKF